MQDLIIFPLKKHNPVIVSSHNWKDFCVLTPLRMSIELGVLELVSVTPVPASGPWRNSIGPMALRIQKNHTEEPWIHQQLNGGNRKAAFGTGNGTYFICGDNAYTWIPKHCQCLPSGYFGNSHEEELGPREHFPSREWRTICNCIPLILESNLIQCYSCCNTLCWKMKYWDLSERDGLKQRRDLTANMENRNVWFLWNCWNQWIKRLWATWVGFVAVM